MRLPWCQLKPPSSTNQTQKGDLEAYFDGHREGPGIWKWRHYFPAYERHFSRFRNKPVRVLEIGIFSGGSLAMWQNYFGPQCQIIGMDIEPACRVYNSDRVQVEIGDQSDRMFWRNFCQKVAPVDIIIDDGGHLPRQQLVTLEEVLGHLNPGGVYWCEDITGQDNPFHQYIDGMSLALHAANWNGPVIEPNTFQHCVESVHKYPFVCVIEKRATAIADIHSDKHGTQWQPFYEKNPVAKSSV